MRFFLSPPAGWAPRGLSAEERALAAEIFADSLVCEPVRLTRDSVMALGAPKAIGNTIHLRSDWGHFVGDTLSLTREGRVTLIHELVHVWQFQNGGLAYIPSSLVAQLSAWLQTGSRGGAYRWRQALERARPWHAWNPEQQAQAVEEFAGSSWRIASGRGTPSDVQIVTLLTPVVAQLRQGEGAARFW